MGQVWNKNKLELFSLFSVFKGLFPWPKQHFHFAYAELFKRTKQYGKGHQHAGGVSTQISLSIDLGTTLPSLQTFSGFSLRTCAHSLVDWFYFSEPAPSFKKSEGIGFTQLVILNSGCELGSSVAQSLFCEVLIGNSGVFQFVFYQVILMCC